MKKYLIFTTIALMAFVASANAQSYTFSNDLTAGSSGQDVINLQTWLISNGYDIPAISSGVTAKGYFGSQTKVALINYQRAVGFPAYGFFGPMTRERLNSGVIEYRAFQVNSPNGGEVWQRGTTQYITWTGAPGVLNQFGDIKLEFSMPACAEPSLPIRCMIAVRAPLTIASGVNLNSGSYAWDVGSVQLPASCLTPNSYSGGIAVGCASPLIADGQYKIQICPTNGSQCDDSDNYFNITSSPSNGQTPVINGVDAPTTLTINQTGTWTVRATDLQNGTLSYSVDWGDVLTYSAMVDCPVGYTCDPSPGVRNATIQQGSTFTHSYSNVGTYTVRFIVRNSAGLTAQTSSTVQVTSSTTAGPLKITSPNGGETWIKGTTQNITWTSPYYFRATNVDLKLHHNCLPGFVCGYVPYTIVTGISANQNSYSWNVGQVTSAGSQYATYIIPIPDGQYTVQICESGTNNCASSSAPFTITSSSSAIRVDSPNSGEVWQSNSTHAITWSIKGMPDVNMKLDLYLDQTNIYVNCITAPCPMVALREPYLLDRNITISTLYNWIVATDINNVAIPAGDYRVRVCAAGGTVNCDSSDGVFTIADSSLYYNHPIGCPVGYSCTLNPL